MVYLTPEEAAGLEVFNAPDMANCAACHPSDPGPGGRKPLFTDFTYDNIGVPKNPENPFYAMPRSINPLGPAWVDLGLGVTVELDDELGKQKVPTLRNVDKRPSPAFVKAYMHNGALKSLEEVVHFYNTRDVESWPSPEYGENVNDEELGDLGLSPDEESALVAFLRTLSDGFEVMPGDLDGSGAIDGRDLGLLLGGWGGAGPADLDGDGVVGTADLAILVGAWTG